MASLFRSRALHTSARVMTEDTRKATSDFLARLTAGRNAGAASAASTNNAARSMIDSVGLRDVTDENRRPFLPNKVSYFRPSSALPLPGEKGAVTPDEAV